MQRGIQDYGFLISGITVASLLFGSAAVAADRVVVIPLSSGKVAGGKFVDGDKAGDAVYTGGNVGIGTTDPQAVLHVGGTAGVDGIMFPDGTLQTSATVQGQAKGLSIGNEVTNTTTGDTWLDRNLGASQVATSSNDSLAYGDLYQWGRGVDGHESRTSPTTTVLSPSDSPKHDNFILAPSSPYDWRDPQKDNLWQGETGVNNPCPSGFRLPTETELEDERLSWSSNNAAGAFASPLKLVVAGYRYRGDGMIYVAGSNGGYWSSTVDGALSRGSAFSSGDAGMGSSSRASGFSVRCLKD